MEKNNIKGFMVFLIAAIIISLFFSNYISAYGLPINMPEKIDVFNKTVNIDVLITNDSASTKRYSINTYTYPFKSTITPDTVLVEPGNDQIVTLSINPLEDSLDTVYVSSIELVSQDNKSIIKHFKIHQNTNKKCYLDLNTNIHYDSNISKYKLSIDIINNTDKVQKLFFKNLDIPSFNEKEFVIDSNSSKTASYNFDTNQDILTLNYICNTINDSMEIEIPEKEKKSSYLSGLITLAKVKDFFNSLTFQIILVFVLVLLVLSFATRYVKYLHFKNK